MVDLSKITLITTVNRYGVNTAIEREVRLCVKGRLIHIWTTSKDIG